MYPQHNLLLVAVDKGHSDIANWLMDEVKVDVNKVNKNGETAIHRACLRNRVEILVDLLQHDADMEMRTLKATLPTHIMSPMGHAVIKDRQECIEILL
jgi:ankyrin repeat protein